MQCPNGDGELLIKTNNRNGLPITYSQCPICKGSWLDAFNANYLKTDDIPQEEAGVATADIHPVCPVCGELLTITHADNIPQSVQAWKCASNHGYFFPRGQLWRFKQAQEAKINYFKLWSVPFPNVASVLLTVFLLFVVSLGLVAIQERQTTQLQAQNILKSQEAFVAGTSVTIAATTTIPADAVVSIGTYQKTLMQTKDHLLHTAFFTHLQPGAYQYYFLFTVNGKTVHSDTFIFTIR